MDVLGWAWLTCVPAGALAAAAVVRAIARERRQLAAIAVELAGEAVPDRVLAIVGGGDEDE